MTEGRTPESRQSFTAHRWIPDSLLRSARNDEKKQERGHDSGAWEERQAPGMGSTCVGHVQLRKPLPLEWRVPKADTQTKIPGESVMKSTYAGILAVAIACSAATTPVCAQNYPDRMITLINPFPPGASTDQISRLIQPKLQAALGQNVVIESKSGAAGNIGMAFVARATPDGYTLLTAPNANFTIAPHFQPPPPFDPLKDFAPITTVAGAPLALVVHKSLGVNNVAELIDYAKKNSGQLSFGSSGVGSPHHVAGELINAKAGINMRTFPTRADRPRRRT